MMDERGVLLATLMDTSARALARGVIERQKQGGADSTDGVATDEALADTEMRLGVLAEACACGRPNLFVEHTAWDKIALQARDIPPSYLEENLHAVAAELTERLPEALIAIATEPVDSALAQLTDMPLEQASFVDQQAPHITLTQRFLLAVLETRQEDALNLLREALKDGVSALEICEHVLSRVQREIGRMWQMGEIHVAEEHLSSRICERALLLVSEHMQSAPKNGKRALTLSVAGDLHEIGSRMISDYLESAGWTPIHLGANVPTEDAILAIRDFEPDLVAVSVSMALHLRHAAELIASCKKHFPHVPILVGGPPMRVEPDLWQVLGADGGSASGSDVMAVAEQLVAN